MGSIWFPGITSIPPSGTGLDPSTGTTVPVGVSHLRGEGLRVRFARIAGVTTNRALRQPIFLPVTLNDFQIDEEFAWTTYQTVTNGEFALPAGGSDPAESYTLRQLDLETLTLDWNASWLVERYVDVDFMRAELYRLARSKTPFQVFATLKFGGPPEIGGPSEVAELNARITRISRTLKHGENDTRYMTLSLEEWRDARIARQSNRAGRGKGADGGTLPNVHRLLADESLYDLSKMYYGDYENWRRIADANGLSGRVGGKDALLGVVSLGLRAGSPIKIPSL